MQDASLPRAEPGARSGPPTEPERLLAAPPVRAILRLATPTTLVMVVASASNVLHTYFVSRLGPDAIAAVSLVFPISLLAITAMGGGIGSGAASAVARALGAGHRGAASVVAAHALALSVVIGILFGAGMLVGARDVFRLMGGGGSVLDSATLFAQVLFGGVAITFVAGMLDSVLRGEGNVRVPAVWSTTSLVLQSVLTPVLMFVVGLGLIGAPLAMLASQLLAALPRARFVLGGRGLVQPSLRFQGHTLGPLREILRVGVPASLSTVVANLGIVVLTGVVARLGDAHLAAYGLGTRLDFLLLSFCYGLAAALLTLVGLATGAGRPDRALAYVLHTGAMAVALVALPAAALCWRPTLWLALFTHDAAVLSVGTEYFRLIGPSYPFVAISMVLSFAFQGLGRATTPLLWMTVRMVGVLAVAVACTRWLGLGARAVFATIAAGNVIAGLGMVALFGHVFRRLDTAGRRR